MHQNHNPNRFNYPKWAILSAIAVYLVTRVVIWIYRPTDFSEIIYSYMPYAHLWASGYTPYLHQWYEYPPATIPLFYLPHLFDMASNHQWFHLNYLEAYRGSLLLVDIFLFALVGLALRKWRAPTAVWVGSLLYYSLVTAKANHFIYDSMDLTFATAMTIGALAPFLLGRGGRLVGWLGYFLATALKYVNAPLGLVYAALEKPRWKQAAIRIGLAGIIVWGVPLVVFRSSLLVSFEYHKLRGLQVESAPATLARTVNSFTNTEHFVEAFKNYDIRGPASTVIQRVYTPFFYLSIFCYTCFLAWALYTAKEGSKHELRLWSTFGYVSLFMVTSTVLSTPFLLWHIPLLAALPVKKLSTKLGLMIASAAIITASMTAIPNLPVGIFSIHLFIGWLRIVLFAFMFIVSTRQLLEIRAKGPLMANR